MKRFLLLTGFIITALISQAQTGTFDRVIAKQAIYIRDRYIDSVQNDTAFMNRVRSVPTSDAVRKFVEGRLAGFTDGATDTANKWVNSITKNAVGDSIVYFIGSTRYAIPLGTGNAWNGQIGQTYVYTANAAIPISGTGILFTGTSPATLTLPTILGNGNKNYLIKNAGTATATIAADGSDVLNTTTDVSTIDLAPGQSAWLSIIDAKWAVLFYNNGGGGGTGLTESEVNALIADSLALLGRTYFVKSDGLTTGIGSTQATAITYTRLQTLSSSFVGGEKIFFEAGGTYAGKLTIKGNSYIGRYGVGAAPIISGTIASTSLTWTQAGTIWSAPYVTRIGRLLRNGKAEKTAQSSFYTVTSNPGSSHVIASSATGISNATSMEMISKEYEFRWTYNTISAYNSGTGEFTLDRANSITSGNQFKLFNHPDLITTEGDWAYVGGTVYYKSPGNVNPNTLNVELSVYEEGLRIEDNAANITIDGIKFYAQSLDGIYGNDNSNVRITNCTFTNQLNHGVAIMGDSKNLTINNNTLSDIGFSGIAGYTVTGFEINRNTLSRIGMQRDSLTDPPFNRYPGARYDNVYACNTGIIVSTFSNNGLIEGNAIDSVAYIGIRADGTNIKVKANKVSNSMTRANDGGGIYTNGNLGDGSSITYNIEVTNNLVWNAVGSFEGAATGTLRSYGVYFDNYTTSSKIIGNTLYDNGSYGIILGAVTKNNVVEGNVLYNNKMGQILILNQASFDAFAYNTTGTKLSNNTFVSLNTNQYNIAIDDAASGSPNVFASGGYARNNNLVTPYNGFNILKNSTPTTVGSAITIYGQPFGLMDTYTATYVDEATAKANVILEINQTTGSVPSILPTGYHNPLGKNFDPLLAPLQGTVFISGATGEGDMVLANDNLLTGTGKVRLPFSADNSNLRIGSLEVQSTEANASYLFGNAYYDGSVYRYRANGYGSLLYFGAGSLGFFGAIEGTAGGVATMSEKFTVSNAGLVKMTNYGAGTATFDASGNISSSSDIRLKNVQGKYKTGLKAIMGLTPIVYKWNKKSGLETKHTYAGFSAQNVKQNIPFGTGEGKDGMLTLQDRAIIAALVNAVKEQQAQIEALKKQISQSEK